MGASTTSRNCTWTVESQGFRHSGSLSLLSNCNTLSMNRIRGTSLMNQRACWNCRCMITGTLPTTTRITTVFCAVCTVCTTSKNNWKDKRRTPHQQCSRFSTRSFTALRLRTMSSPHWSRFATSTFQLLLHVLFCSFSSNSATTSRLTSARAGWLVGWLLVVGCCFCFCCCFGKCIMRVYVHTNICMQRQSLRQIYMSSSLV